MVSIKQSKFIKSLKIKKYRIRENCFIIEGKKNVLEAIKSKCKLRYIVGTNDFILSNREVLESYGAELIEATSKELVELGTFQLNNDCLAVGEMPDRDLGDVSYSDHIVLLDGVSDPGNLGTIIRTLDWFGFTQLVCSTDCADFYNPKVINATMGSFSRISPYYTDLCEFISSSQLASYGADLNGRDINHWVTNEPVMFVMGSESHGISVPVRNLLDSTITIPKYGDAESLNVGIAMGIICQQLRSCPF